jgi:hypothetical protein
MYAQARDGTGSRSGLASISKHGAPGNALAVVLLIFLGALVGQQLAHSSVINATFYPLQIGTVLILVAYVMATLGAIRYLFFTGEPKAPRWQLIVPILGGAFVCYTIYRNVFVGQVGTYHRLPYIEGAYLVIGLLIVCLAPGLAARVRDGLREDRGMTPEAAV